jgi:hypothetical protein
LVNGVKHLLRSLGFGWQKDDPAEQTNFVLLHVPIDRGFMAAKHERD